MKTVKVRNGDNNILPNSLNYIPNSLNYTILFPTHSLESFDFSSTYSYACVFLTIFVGWKPVCKRIPLGEFQVISTWDVWRELEIPYCTIWNFP